MAQTDIRAKYLL